MPLTFFAHQVPVVPMKLARPRWFDGTALVVGSMAPDLAYSVSGYLHLDTHDWEGMPLVVPLGLVVTMMVRCCLAALIPTALPDLGDFRLCSWAVLYRRFPAWWRTVVGVCIGAATHVVLDSFTHVDRNGAKWLGYNDTTLTILGRTGYLASAFQYGGHLVGTIGGVWLLWLIGKRRLLEQWYGDQAVEQARAARASHHGQIVLVGLLGTAALVGLWWASTDRYNRAVLLVNRPAVAMAVAGCLAWVIPVCRPAPNYPRGG